MTWPIKESDKLLPKGDAAFAPHEGLKDLNKAQWEEPMNPDDLSPSQATFKGGAPQPMPPKQGNLEDDFGGSVFSTLTGKRLDLNDTTRSH